MSNLVLRLNVNRVDLVKEGCNTAAFIKLTKGRNEIMTIPEILDSMTPEHSALLKAHIDGLELVAKSVPTLTADLAKAKGDVTLLTDKVTLLEKTAPAVIPTATTEDLIKGLPEALQSTFTAVLEKAKTSEAALAAFVDVQKTKDATLIAQSLKALPFEETELVDVVKSADAKTLEVLKKAAATIESNLLTPKGTSTPGTDFAGKDAMEVIEKEAKIIATNEGLTYEKAFSKALTNNPSLYEQYMKEVRS